ncbi:hypothetical protein [Massilia glaciei]|nr:hypothetical protein [Massilia glaciei]
MFWRVIRWGGTVIVMLLVLAAIFAAPRPDDSAPVRHDDPAQQSSKNFNL